MTNPKHTDTSRSDDPVAWMVTATTMENHRRSVLLTEPDPEIWDTITPLYPADCIEALEAENERLREELVGVAASLAAAISLLERGGKAAKKAAPSDLMFDQMVRDYTASLERARAALGEKQ